MKLRHLFPLALVIAALFTAGCIDRDTGAPGLPDTDEDDRTGIDEIGDQDDQQVTGDADQDEGVDWWLTNDTDDQTMDNDSVPATHADTDIEPDSPPEGDVREEGFSDETCTPEGVCGTAHDVDFYSTGHTGPAE